MPVRTSRQTTWETLNDLENAEGCRSAGGHGNQHVRLRSAQVDSIKAICPAPAATCCFEPGRRAIDAQRRFTFRNDAEIVGFASKNWICLEEAEFRTS
jgi:hypothetical protein